MVLSIFWHIFIFGINGYYVASCIYQKVKDSQVKNYSFTNIFAPGYAINFVLAVNNIGQRTGCAKNGFGGQNSAPGWSGMFLHSTSPALPEHVYLPLPKVLKLS